MMEKISREYHILCEEGERIVHSCAKFSPVDASLFPYLKTIKYLKGMTDSLWDNFGELLKHEEISTVMRYQKFLVDDLYLKLDELHKYLLKKQAAIPENSQKQSCFICNQNIHENNIKYVKNTLEQNYKKQFNQAMNQFRKMSQQELFTEEQNESYEKKLYMNLAQKQKVLNMYSRQIQQFVTLVDKSVAQLGALKEMEEKQIERNVEETRYVNMGKIGEDVSKFLQASFENKIPPWIEKIFAKLIKRYVKQLKSRQLSTEVQTVPHESSEKKELKRQNTCLKKKVEQLEEEFKEHLIYAEKLKNLLKEKQTTDLENLQVPKLKHSSYSMMILSSIQEKNNQGKSQNEPPSDRSSEINIQEKETESDLNYQLSEKQKKKRRKVMSKFSKKQSISKSKKKNSLEMNLSSDSVDEGKKPSSEESPRHSTYQKQEQIKEMDPDLEADHISEKSHGNISKRQSRHEENEYFRNQHQNRSGDRNSFIKGEDKRKSQMRKLSKQAFHDLKDKFSQEKIMAQKVSELMEKKSRMSMSKGSLFPKLNDRIKQNKFEEKRRSRNTQRLENKQNSFSNSPPFKLKTEVFNEQKKQSTTAQRKQEPTTLHQQVSLQKIQQKKSSKHIEKTSYDYEEKIYNVLKTQKITPENLSLTQFKTLLREEKMTEHLIQRQNSALSIHQSEKEKKDSFIKEDYELFLVPKVAYRYEESLKKNYHRRHIMPLTAKQTNACHQIYTSFHNLRSQDPKRYNKLCSLLRYPYQTLYNDFSILNFVTDMNYQTFELYFKRVLQIHRKCGDHDFSRTEVCCHVRNFFKHILHKQI